MSNKYWTHHNHWSTRAVEWIQFSLGQALRWVTWPVPTWTLSGVIAPVGAAAIMAVPKARRRALKNLALVWPDKPEDERRKIAWSAARHFIRLGIEYAQLEKLARKANLQVQGVEHLKTAAEAGKGGILVTAHYGNWEAARLASMQAGIESGIIYRAFNNRYLDRLTMRMIPCAGRPVLQKGHKGMRRLVAHVARGGFVMILVDQRNSGAPYLDFLGHPAETVTAAADLAARTGAALIPTRAVRNVAERRFDVQFEAPVTGQDAETMMQEVNNRISAWIEEYPEQWFWFHRRWRQTWKSRGQPGGPAH